MATSRMLRLVTFLILGVVTTGCGGGGGGGGDVPKADPIEIRIDGDFKDWIDVPILASEGTNNTDHPNGMDFVELRVHQDPDWLYVFVRSADWFRFLGDGTITGGILDERETARMTCVLRLDLDGNGTHDCRVYGVTLASYDNFGYAVAEPGIVRLAPYVLDGNRSIDRFECAIPRASLESVQPSLRAGSRIGLQVRSELGSDNLPSGNTLVSYVLK